MWLAVDITGRQDQRPSGDSRQRRRPGRVKKSDRKQQGVGGFAVVVDSDEEQTGDERELQ